MCLADTSRSRTTFFISQLALVLMGLLTIPSRHYPQFHPDMIDGARGFFLGIALATMIVMGLRNRRRSRL